MEALNQLENNSTEDEEVRVFKFYYARDKALLRSSFHVK